MRKHLSLFVPVLLIALPLVAGAQTASPQTQPPAQATQAQATQAQAAQAPPAQAPAPSPAAQPVVGPTILLEQILVKVNGDIVTKTELEARQVDEIRRRGQQMSDEQLKKAVAEMTPDLLVATIDDLLLQQRGKELGYKVTEDQFKRVLENIRKENKLESDEAFAAALKQEGLDMTQLRRNLERQLVVNQVVQVEVDSKLGITEAEARKYYETNKSEFTTPASITLRELMVAVPTDGKTVNVALDEETQKKAEGALARLKAGESFEKLVTEMSDAPSKANGGLVGPLQPEELAPDIKKLIDPLKPGQTTNVFRTPKGFGILKLETSTPIEIKSFEQARDQIANKVFGEKRQAELDRYLRKLRSEGIIEWKNDEMQKLWIARTSAPLAAPKNPGL